MRTSFFSSRVLYRHQITFFFPQAKFAVSSRSLWQTSFPAKFYILQGQSQASRLSGPLTAKKPRVYEDPQHVLPYLKNGIRNSKSKRGRELGLKVYTGCGMPKIIIGITGLLEIWFGITGLKNPIGGLQTSYNQAKILADWAKMTILVNVK